MIFNYSRQIYLIAPETDLRLGIDGYAHIVQDHYRMNPMSESFYCFTNKRHNRLKILYWDSNGFWLFYKRLEKSTFKWPKRNDECIEINEKQLGWLLEGLSIEQKRAFRDIHRQFV